MPLSNDYKKFLAAAPRTWREYRTIELYHPQFSPTTQRFVSDFADVNLTLEAGAPRNASASVTFKAISMAIVEPGESAESDQQLTVSMGAVGKEVRDVVDQITGSGYLTPVQIIYRKYLDNESTKALILVLYLSASNLRFEEYTGVGFTAEDHDFTNKPSGEIYTFERFPGLRNT